MPSGMHIPTESPLQRLERQAKQASKALSQQAQAQSQTIDTGSAIKRKPAQEIGEGSPTAVSLEEEQKTFYEGTGRYQGADLSRSSSIKREAGRPRAKSELRRSNAVRDPHRAPSVRKPQKPSGLRTLEVPPKDK